MTQATTQNGWTETTLGEVCEVSSSKRIFAKEYQTSGIPFFRGKEVTEKFNGNNVSTELFITEKKYNEIKSKFGVPQENDILLTSVGTLGNPYLVEKNFKFYFKDGNLTWFRNYKNIDPKFLFYWIVSPDGKESLSHSKIGSTQQAYTIVSLKRSVIILPSLPEQRAIAAVLSSLDDKIELLREQNKTLEETAQAIFKEWFGKYSVDRPEELPEGWRIGTLGDISINYSESFKFSDKEVVFINTGDVLEGQFLHSNKISPNGLPGQAKKAIGLHDILYSEIRPKNKRFAFVDFDTSDYVVSTKFMVIRPISSFSPFILYLILKNQNSINEFNTIAESRSGTFPQITFDSIKKFPVIIPSIKSQSEFEQVLISIMKKDNVNNKQIQTLSTLRDTLLPRLMRGEVRVAEFYT
ncbi:restriction endonuclease subunit S [Candidatus Peregrinibacteria bacterium]|nr:MAG: restriction endonuclease subunit S [Candidatus Peregrinibacteria bacterium]